jgi:rod shape-determining protein MreC
MRRRRGGAKLIMILSLGLFLVVARQQGWLTPVGNLLMAAGQPVGRALSGAGRAAGRWLPLGGGTSGEDAQLRQELSELRSEVVRLKEMEAQNKQLRQQLRFAEEVQAELLPAEVIAYQPDNYRQFLTIKRGSRDGIKAGQAVVAEGFLIGRVSEVMPGSAKVFLIINPDFKVNGLAQETRASGTVRGQLGAGLVMDKIPQGEQVKPGDNIVTSGLGGQFPKGLLIGQVEAVDQSENAIFQSAQLATGVKFNKLELVFVVEQ